MKTAIDFKNAAIRKEIKRWDIHNCSMCNYACGYVIDNDRVFYDSGCDCTYRGQNLSPRSFEDIADHYNMQSNETVIQRMNEFWGFSDNENNAENSDQKQLLENWENAFPLNVIYGESKRQLVELIEAIRLAQEAKIREECAEIVDGMECYTQGVYDKEEIEKTKQKILNPNSNQEL